MNSWHLTSPPTATTLSQFLGLLAENIAVPGLKWLESYNNGAQPEQIIDMIAKEIFSERQKNRQLETQYDKEVKYTASLEALLKAEQDHHARDITRLEAEIAELNTVIAQQQNQLNALLWGKKTE